MIIPFSNLFNLNTSEFNGLFVLESNFNHTTQLTDFSTSSLEGVGQEMLITRGRDWEGEATTDDMTIFYPSIGAANSPADLLELGVVRIDYYRDDYNIRSPFEEDYSVIYQDSTVAMYMCQATTGIVGLFIFYFVIILCTDFIQYKNENNKLNSMYNSFYFNVTYYSLKILQTITNVIRIVQAVLMFNIAVGYLKSMT